MANHFNDLLLQTLKQINVRLDRVDGRMERLDDRMDRLMETKSDKTDLDATNEKLDTLREELSTKADKSDLDVTNGKLDTLREEVRTDIRGLGSRIERIEAGIGTLKWVIGAEVAVIGVILAFIKAC